jgi:hypothetical protein
MSNQRTQLLIVLLLIAGVAAVLGYAQLERSRDAAVRSAADLADCRQQLADLARWRGQSNAASATPDDPELNRSLRSAATIAGVADQLISIEPGQPTPVRDSDFSETPVYVRLRALSLRQLVTFLHQLSTSNSSVRAKSIELSPPLDAPATPTMTAGDDEQWTGDVTLAYLIYTPRPRAGTP